MSTTTTTDFRSILSTNMDAIKRPEAWPAGTYHGVIKSHELGVSRNNKTPYCRYHISITNPGDDVDTDELAAALGDKPINERDWRKDYYLTEDARYRIKELHESLSIPTEGRSLGECIPEANQSRVILTITQRLSEDGKTKFNDVGDVRGEE